MKAFLCIAGALWSSGFARAATIEVPAQHATIQAAIDAAADGDTVLVAPGVYPEAIQIAKAITVEGAGRAASFVAPAPSPIGHAVTLSSPGAVLRGFDVKGAIFATASALIEENAIHETVGAPYCIYAYGYQGAADPIIQNNRISACPDGIVLFWSGAVIRNNVIVQNLDAGIDVSWAWPLIENNTIANNGVTGIEHFYYSSARIRNNVVANNGLYGIIDTYYAGPPVHEFNLVGGNGVVNYAWTSDAQPIAAHPTELNVPAGFVNAPLFTSLTSWPGGGFSLPYDGLSLVTASAWGGQGGIGPYVKTGLIQLGTDSRLRTVKDVEGATVYFAPDMKAQPVEGAGALPEGQFAGLVNYLGESRDVSYDWRLSPTSPALHAGDPAPEYANVDGTRNTLGATGGPNARW